MRAGRSWLFVRKFGHAEMQVENVDRCRDAWKCQESHETDGDKTSPQGVRSKARSANEHA